LHIEFTGETGMKYAVLTFFWAVCTVPAEAVLWREVEQEGTAKFPFTIYSNFRVISKKHYYGKAERDEGFFGFVLSEKMVSANEGKIKRRYRKLIAEKYYYFCGV
jgi:hypothetical protein